MFLSSSFSSALSSSLSSSLSSVTQQCHSAVHSTDHSAVHSTVLLSSSLNRVTQQCHSAVQSASSLSYTTPVSLSSVSCVAHLIYLHTYQPSSQSFSHSVPSSEIRKLPSSTTSLRTAKDQRQCSGARLRGVNPAPDDIHCCPTNTFKDRYFSGTVA